MKKSLTTAAVTDSPDLGKSSLANVPATEAKVLDLLRRQESEGKPTHGPAIARASNGAISVAAIYTLLDRLAARGLVTKKTEMIKVQELDQEFKRVVYQCAVN